MERIR